MGGEPALADGHADAALPDGVERRRASTRPAASGHDDYVSDPAKPVPFLPRPIDMDDADQWHSWLVHDQRFVDGRPDVLTYTSAPLTKAVHIMGAPQVDLFAATSGTDSDWVVKLIDVYPERESGRRSPGLEARHVGLRAADRDRDLPRPLCRQLRQAARADARQGRANISWNLPNVDHVFLPGHRIMVQVQSSLFPLYDRNPQTFVPNIFYAKAGDYRAATQSVFYGGNNASAVYLPIVP